MEKKILQEAPEILRSVGEDGNEYSTRAVKGYAAVFSSVSEDLGFREVLAPGSITQETIERSTVLARVNHDDSKVVAKCRNGEGTLKLSVDEKGLRYEFEAPKTAAGDELLELIERGDINQSSFAFTIAEGGDEWRYADGEYIRTINKVDRLYDVAPVFMPAYSATECHRCEDILEKHKSRMEAHRAHLESLQDDDSEILEWAENVRAIYAKADAEVRELTDQERADVQKYDGMIRNRKTVNAQEAEAEACKEESKKSEKMTERKKSTLALVRAIAAVVNGREFDAETSAIIAEGRAQMQGISTTENAIYIPTQKRALDVATEGADTIGIDVAGILEPLRQKNVLAKAGAKFLTGLNGKVLVPVMTAGDVTWEGETATPTSDAGTGFTSVTLEPKRLTAYIDLSKQLIAQMSEDVEGMVANDLVNAINSKLEKTILGSGAGSTTQPAGLFTGTPGTISDFAGLANLEADVEDAGVLGECKYIVSNKAKAKLRVMAKSAKTTQLVMEAGQIDGTEVLNSGNVDTTGVAYGDWGNLVVGQWGAVEVIVDPYTQAAAGKVRLVVNSYWDAKVARANAIKVATV